MWTRVTLRVVVVTAHERVAKHYVITTRDESGSIASSQWTRRSFGRYSHRPADGRKPAL